MSVAAAAGKIRLNMSMSVNSRSPIRTGIYEFNSPWQ